MLFKIHLVALIIAASFLCSFRAHAAPLTFNVDGVVTDGSNNPLEAAAVIFQIDIRNPAGSCLLYREQFNVDMTGSNGYFSIVLGKQANMVAGGVTLEKVFSNQGAVIPGNSCTYTPGSTSDTRTITISFNDGTTAQTFSTQEIQSVPFALEAVQANKVGDYTSTEILKTSSTVSQVTYPNSALNQAQYDEFWRLVLNPLAAYLPATGEVTNVSGNSKIGSILGQALPAAVPTNGQVLVSNGTTWALQSLSSGSVTSVTATAPVVAGGTATAPVISMPVSTVSADGYLDKDDFSIFAAKQSSALSNTKIWVGNISGAAEEQTVSGDATLAANGALTLKNTGAAGTYGSATLIPIVTTDAQGRITSVTTAAPLDATKLPLTGGSMSGDIVMSGGKITGMTNVPNVAVNPAVGDNGKSLRWNNGSSTWEWFTAAAAGAGITSLNSQSGSSQSFGAIDLGTSVTAPAWSSASDIHTLKIPMASDTGVTAGLLNKTDHTSFSSKLTSPLTTKGDLLSRDGSAHVRLPVGTNNQVLTADSAEASGLKWTTLPSTGITALTGDITATGPGSVAATIGVGKVTSSHILDGEIVGADMNFTGLNIATSNIVIKDSTGKFYDFGCSTTGHIATWSVTGWSCAAPAAALDATKLPLAGGTMAGNIVMGGNKITGMTNVPNVAANPVVGDDGKSLRWNNTAGQWEWFTASAAGAGITSLNGQSGNSQSFAAIDLGTSVTAPAWSSATDIHTLKIPMASDTGVTAGLLNKTDYDKIGTVADSYVTSTKIADGTIMNIDINASAAIDATKIHDGTISNTEFGYLNNVSSNIQTQIDAKLASPLTNKGDLLSRDGSSHVRLPVGTNNQVLTADSAEASGLKWTTLPGAGISALTGDVTATGPGSVAATIGVGKVTSSHILDGEIVGADMNFTGVNIATSNVVIKDSTGKFFEFGCSTTGHVATWSVTGWSCAAPASAPITNTASLANTKIWIGDGGGKAQEFALSGDATMSAGGVVSLASTISAAGPIGGVSTIPVITYDAKGRLTTVTTATVNDTTKLPLAGGTMTGNLTMDNQKAVIYREDSGNGTNSATIKAPAVLAADYTLTLPVDDGTSGQVLSTDGLGVLSWVSTATGTVTSVATGTGLTGGPVTSTGTISLANIANNTVLANTSGSAAAPVSTTVPTLLDTVGNTQGNIMYRNGTAWTVLAPGTAGQVLQTGGAAANPSWVTGPTAGITALTGDVTATGPGSAAASIGTGKVTSSHILDGEIVGADMNFTGLNIATSNIVIKDSTGKFYDFGCSTTGHVATWSVTGWSCAAPAGGLGFTPVNKAGDTMTGALTVGGNIQANSGQVYANQNIVASGTTVNFDTGNVQIIQAPGSAALTLNNMKDGGSYTLIITDTASRQYTFTNCTNAKYVPTNDLTTAGTQSIYTITKVTISSATYCYISWVTGF